MQRIRMCRSTISNPQASCGGSAGTVSVSHTHTHTPHTHTHTHTHSLTHSLTLTLTYSHTHTHTHTHTRSYREKTDSTIQFPCHERTRHSTPSLIESISLSYSASHFWDVTAEKQWNSFPSSLIFYIVPSYCPSFFSLSLHVYLSPFLCALQFYGSVHQIIRQGKLSTF